MQVRIGLMLPLPTARCWIFSDAAGSAYCRCVFAVPVNDLLFIGEGSSGCDYPSPEIRNPGTAASC
jgi:hypothetical protein